MPASLLQNQWTAPMLILTGIVIGVILSGLAACVLQYIEQYRNRRLVNLSDVVCFQEVSRYKPKKGDVVLTVHSGENVIRIARVDYLPGEDVSNHLRSWHSPTVPAGMLGITFLHDDILSAWPPANIFAVGICCNALT